MNSFKLLRLPWLAFQEIIRTMDFVPLFNLSLVSNRMFLKMKMAKRKILPINLALKKETRMVRITDEKFIEGEEIVYKLNFYLKKNVADKERERFMKNKKIGGHEVEIFEQHIYPKSPGFFGCYNENFFDFFRRLLDLFDCPGTVLMITKGLIFEMFLANLVGLNIISVGIPEEEHVMWTAQELSILLAYAKPTLQLILQCPLTSDYNDKSTLKFPHIKIRFAKWLKIEDIIATNNSTIVLEEHNLTENDLKQYIQQWLAGNNQSLVRFQCGKLRTRPNWDEILEDVEYSKWNEKRRSRYHIYNSINCISVLDCEDGLDFERSDGKLATVFQNSNWFCFAVWHHRVFTKKRHNSKA